MQIREDIVEPTGSDLIGFIKKKRKKKKKKKTTFLDKVDHLETKKELLYFSSIHSFPSLR